MNETDDKKKFVAIMGALGVVFKTEVTEPLLLAYWMALKDMTMGAFEDAATKSIKTSKFMPSVAELRELAGVKSETREAEDDFDTLISQVRSVGAYKSPNLSPIIRAVVNSLGGWIELCGKDSEEIHKWYKRDFIAKHIEFSKCPPTEHQARALPGIHERGKLSPARADVMGLVEGLKPE